MGNDVSNKSSDINDLMGQMNGVIAEQNKNSLEDYFFSFYQEKRYRISEKIEDILSEEQRLALYLQRKLHKYSSSKEAVQWLNESPNLLHDWEAPLHKSYLKKAGRLLLKNDFKEAIDLINVVLNR